MRSGPRSDPGRLVIRLGARHLGLLLAALLAAATPAAAEPLSPSPGPETQPEARGVVKAVDRAVLSGEIAARIRRLPKRAGESFRRGEVLVAFACELFVAQRDKVAAELKAARTKLENDRQMARLNSIGALEVALSEAEVEKAEAEWRIVELNVARCVIAAPYDGKVVRVMVNEHESVRQQQELIEIVGSGRLEAEIVVPGPWLSWLAAGQKLTIAIDETGETVPGRIVAIGAAVDPVSQSATLRARFDAGRAIVVPGMSGTARFPAPEAAAPAKR